MNISRGMVEKLYRDYKDKFGGNINSYFGWLYLSKKYDLPVEELEDVISFNENKSGIDAYYIDRKLKYLYLYQFKWSDECSDFKDNLLRLRDQGLGVIFNTESYNLTKFEKRLQSQLQDNSDVINKVVLCLVYNGDVEEARNSQILKSLCEDLESKKYLIDDFFGGTQVSFTIQFSSNETRNVQEIVQNITTYRYTIDFSSSLRLQNSNNELLNIGFIRLSDLRSMYKQMKYRFFDKNIRFGLSPDNPPNKSIMKSLDNIIIGKETTAEFAFNHNGITLYVERIELNGEKAEIVEPRILNGAQTVTVFDNFITSRETDKEMARKLKQLNDIRVICKIISQASPEFVTNVTICTNKQNPVEPWNLRASDFIQLQFDDKFRRELGVFYERQENAFQAFLDTDPDSIPVSKEKAVQIRKLAQTFLALQGEVEKISRLSDLFENDGLYYNTFRKSYLDADARLILLCYKIQYRLPSIIKEIQDRGQTKYAYINRARNLIWCLLAQGVLNDNISNRLAERFGGSLTMENDYADYLKDMASRRIRPIISELTEDPLYQRQMENNIFTFFRTKAVFAKCMDIAANRFGWQKCSI